tara:strand:+ start:311 stop:535 length:225 start_codon:yes stop_codon:yes gene_type:complete
MKININTDDIGIDLLLKSLKMLSLHGKELQYSWIKDIDVENALRMTKMIRNGLDKAEVKYEGLPPSKCEEGVCD